jgi:uncharacterized protein
LGFEGLSQTLRLLLAGKLDAAQRAASQSDHSWEGWRRFAVDEVVAETSAIRSIHFLPLDDLPLAQPKPGQSVTVRLASADGIPVIRTWSLSNHAPDMNRYRLTVRRQGGPGSSAFQQLTVGDEVELRAPRGHFTLDGGSFRPLVLIAAGIGITPVYAMLQAHLRRPGAPPVYLIYGGKSPDEVAFRETLDGLAAAHPHLHLHWVFSGTDQPGRPRGRITSALVRELLADLYILLDGRRIDLPWHEAEIYMCGPNDFCETILAELTAQGANPDHLYFERFEAAIEVETAMVEWSEVRFAKSDVVATWRAEDRISLLELAERSGVAVDSDCRTGNCLTCRTNILEGDVTSALGDGTGLLCIGRPKTQLLLLDC